MSRTFRRTNIGTTVAESYMIDPNNLVIVDGKLKEIYNGQLISICDSVNGQNPKQFAEKNNSLFFTDNHNADSSPKRLRQTINRAERKRVKQDIIKALRDDSIDEFIDARMKLPF